LEGRIAKKERGGIQGVLANKKEGLDLREGGIAGGVTNDGRLREKE